MLNQPDLLLNCPHQHQRTMLIQQQQVMSKTMATAAQLVQSSPGYAQGT